MSKYASETSVSVDKSRSEIERTLQRYGATAFAYMTNSNTAIIMFEISNRRVKFVLPLPDRASREFWYTEKTKTRRTEAQAFEFWEQACRQRWRALLLVIKAKLEAVEAGITSVEREFLAYVVLPDGSTVGEWAKPQLEQAYERGTMPPMLPQ